MVLKTIFFYPNRYLCLHHIFLAEWGYLCLQVSLDNTPSILPLLHPELLFQKCWLAAGVITILVLLLSITLPPHLLLHLLAEHLELAAINILVLLQTITPPAHPLPHQELLFQKLQPEFITILTLPPSITPYIHLLLPLPLERLKLAATTITTHPLQHSPAKHLSNLDQDPMATSIRFPS